ncbi:MAG: hypothetical protein ACOX1P_22035 [Thermoguttaceae bacterium]
MTAFRSPVTGTFSDEADDHMTYSYTILASISDGAWALSGTGDNEAKGTAGTSYSGSGSFSSGGFEQLQQRKRRRVGVVQGDARLHARRSRLGGHQRLGQHFARLLEESDF